MAPKNSKSAENFKKVKNWVKSFWLPIRLENTAESALWVGTHE